jgi:hypothetical protein
MATKQNFLCVDLKFEGNTSVIKEGESRKGVLSYENEDKFHFTESEGKPHVAHPELHWRLLDRTKHGRVHVNANHVKVEFYIHHTDYADGRDLADLLAREIETMGENLSETDMQAEVDKCC